MENLLSEERSRPALYMVWRPDTPAGAVLPPTKTLGPEYEVRHYQDGDEQRLLPLFHQEGWVLEQRDWHDYLDHLLPHGLFILWHRPRKLPVGTIGAIHNPRAGRYYFPFGGELAYLVIHPAHRGTGFGAVLSLHALRRLQEAGYCNIWVGVHGYRLAAIKTYLRLGFQPLVHQAQLAERWHGICEQLVWPFAVEAWPNSIPGGANL